MQEPVLRHLPGAPARKNQPPVPAWVAFLTRVSARRRLVWLAFFVLGGTVGAVAMWLASMPPQPAVATAFTEPVPVASVPAPAAMAPDGSPSAEVPIVPTPATIEDPVAPPAAAAEASATSPVAPDAAARAGNDTPPAAPASASAAADAARTARGGTGDGRAARQTPAGFRGSIAVQSEPNGARVFVNGQAVGSTPLVLRDLAIGSRVVRVEAQGFQRWSTSVRVVANQQTRITAKLNRTR